jgi:hypothetical protein
MNPYICALTLILSCGSRSAAVLNVSHAAVAFADSYYTQRSFGLCRDHGRCWNIEANALTRPFQRNGSALAYQSTYAGLSVASFTAQKMRISRNRILRSMWWLPQAALMGASMYGAYTQARDYRSTLAACGAACASTVGK